MFKKILFSFVLALLFAPFAAQASVSLKLDRAPDRATDNAALQNGAKLFINNCLNCHGASYVRYNRLTDIGLTEQQIKDNLLFTAEKIGEPMGISMPRKDAKEFFGAWPPDLSLIARARASGDGSGADWLYTYLRGFYRDEKRPTGWNNVVFDSVGMPHVLWELQGEQVMGADHKLTLAKPGKLTPREYDDAVGDLVAFMVWMAEPQASFRKNLGIAVLLFLGVFFVVAYAMKRAFWKDIH
ncbi:MAG: cytochrome c1 [Rhodocyclaceae bacterium]|nr:cytochrome c1 [Rhodocyclaceae bacterium]MCP5297674.1 cytochrome c1 [Zoogloeaceae bacterium]MBX3677243.1 cytochrome c1 [Rhodocyclaceae bacterium]MBZ0132960.1 cytochrome c1 [Rhodocyclaceae bacterium]MCB1891523.1 cytochrome c1 [Rhodocyclaceae bacterium]